MYRHIWHPYESLVACLIIRTAAWLKSSRGLRVLRVFGVRAFFLGIGQSVPQDVSLIQTAPLPGMHYHRPLGQQNAAESFTERVYDGARLRLQHGVDIPA